MAALLSRPRILWHYVFVEDGPLVGVAVLDEKMVWFDRQPGSTEVNFYTLTGETIDKLVKEQNRFRVEAGFFHEHNPGLYRPFYSTALKPIAFHYDIPFSTIHGEKIASFPASEVDHFMQPTLLKMPNGEYYRM